MYKYENVSYYKGNIKTSKNEDSIYAMRYASQQMLIDKITKENEKIKAKYNKALQLLAKDSLPCEIDDFNTKEENIDYCSQNCSVDERIFIKCWDRFIEQELKEVK